MTLDTIQYMDSPMGNCKEKKAIITGIIHSIIVWLDCCRGSVDGEMVIFCWTQVDTNTSKGTSSAVICPSPNDPGPSAKLIPMKSAFRGAAEYMLNMGIQEYSFCDRPTRSSGAENSVCIRTRNSPIRMGICTTNGPRQPTGLTPASRYIRIVSWEMRLRSFLYRS